eukprot:11819496-Alexandrium_andersonii.AAC.1
MSASLVGSEMCIRDSRGLREQPRRSRRVLGSGAHRRLDHPTAGARRHRAVSYTHLTLPTICSV